MIWLTWRQSRLESLIGGAALALVAIFALWTGLHIASTYHDLGLPACVASHGDGAGCGPAANDFLYRFTRLDTLKTWLNFLPFLIGLLVAVPTVLDLEQGTYRLAWTQSVTRRRWLAMKLGFGSAIAVGASTIMVALWTWWRGPFDALDGRFGEHAFDFEGTVPIAYTVFAFALCLTIGVVLRRTIPMIGIGLVGFLAARLSVLNELRPHYLHPVTLTWDPTAPEPNMGGMFGDGSWVIDRGFVASGGQTAVNDALRACGGQPAGNVKVVPGDQGDNVDAFNRCLHDHGTLNSISYHPASRFWTFQVIETALFLGLAAVLIALAAWWVLRRIA